MAIHERMYEGHLQAPQTRPSATMVRTLASISFMSYDRFITNWSGGFLDKD